MSEKQLTATQKQRDVDLWIIVICSVAVLLVFSLNQIKIMSIVKDTSVPILLRVLMTAAMQFGLAGFGISVVALIHRESFLIHGLKLKGALLSVALCVACYVPNIIFMFVTKQIDSYLPFQSVWTTKEVLASGFPVNAVGMLITATAWGFFEGFNYVFISDVINERYPSKNKWINWGAISCAIFCILIHGAIGVTPEGIIEMLTVMFLIYGMLIVRERTGNAWGCVAVFVFIWNAL
ncbi:MAG TPA: hypothetical protein VJZ01_12165 [Lachnospiraceae bacterium]|nr:hypothetical protein [Lachnospiraceae bacterium]